MSTNKFELPSSIKLDDLKQKECTLLELQASLVYLIDLYNKQSKDMEQAINELQRTKSNKEWRANL